MSIESRTPVARRKSRCGALDRRQLIEGHFITVRSNAGIAVHERGSRLAVEPVTFHLLASLSLPPDEGGHAFP